MHTCHAKNCQIEVQPKLFMCKTHWYKLPRHLRESIWASYRSGQEVDKNPSEMYLSVAKLCIEYVAKLESVVEIYIRLDWIDKLHCCMCESYSLVSSGSDGHMYCEQCRKVLVEAMVAELGGFHTTDKHDCKGVTTWIAPIKQDKPDIERGTLF